MRTKLNLFGMAMLKGAAAAIVILSIGCQKQDQAFDIVDGEMVRNSPMPGDSDFDDHDHENDVDDAGVTDFVVPFGCTKANAAQIATIKKGNAKYSAFMKGCHAATANSRWCEQLTRPNPSSRSTFICTYGSDLPHRLIHPDESTWKNAYAAVKLVKDLEAKGIKVAQIYNWWRPAPYNGNVGGAAGRHPFGTSVDVRMSTIAEMKKAHTELCKYRKQGRLRALGYYGSTGLHFGVGDKTANTWGKSCP